MNSEYCLTVRSEFSAAHSLRGYEGRCARVHGHNYKIHLEITAHRLDAIGFVVDYYDIKTALQNAIDQLDHHNINEIVPFTTENPTAENIAAWFYKQLSATVNNGQIAVTAVTLFETDDFSLRYSERE